MDVKHVHRIVDPSTYTAPSDAVTAQRNGNTYVFTSESKVEGAEQLAEFRPQEFDPTFDVNDYIKKATLACALMGYGAALLISGGLLYARQRTKKRNARRTP